MNRNIRFWDIPIPDCKSCLVIIEAATEKQGLHKTIPALFEAAETGKTGGRADTGGGC
jgi:hypothetical protein